MSKHDLAFYSGVAVALNIVQTHGLETVFHEIVAAAGRDDLLAYAIAEDEMEFSGLACYGYGADVPMCPHCQTPHKAGANQYCAY